jgi:toxin ParE1/3/4
MAEMERALSFISEKPESWPAFEAGTRRFLLRRFPYSIVYRLCGEEIQVVAIAHTKRRPRYWRDR